MCGIAGYYGRKIIGVKNINSTAIRMRNRGPDKFYCYIQDYQLSNYLVKQINQLYLKIKF